MADEEEHWVNWSSWKKLKKMFLILLTNNKCFSYYFQTTKFQWQIVWLKFSKSYIVELSITIDFHRPKCFFFENYHTRRHFPGLPQWLERLEWLESCKGCKGWNNTSSWRISSRWLEFDTIFWACNLAKITHSGAFQSSVNQNFLQPWWMRNSEI